MKDGHHHQTSRRPEEDDWKDCVKEDDTKGKKEDDPQKVSNIRKRFKDRDGHRPPPLGGGGVTSLNRTGNQPVTTGDPRSTQGVVNMEGCSGTTRAATKCGEKKSNVKEENITTGRSRISGITVNGIDLMELQRVKGDSKKKNKKADGKQSGKSKVDKSSPAPPSVNIRKFLKPDEKKTTITPLENPSFKSAMQKFRTVSRGTECAVRSGYCTSHNVKCVREVKMKKVSEIDRSGRLSWLTREVCTLTCPSKPKITTKPGGLANSAPEGTNGKLSTIFGNVMDQPTQPKTNKKTDGVILLDETS